MTEIDKMIDKVFPLTKEQVDSPNFGKSIIPEGYQAICHLCNPPKPLKKDEFAEHNKFHT